MQVIYRGRVNRSPETLWLEQEIAEGRRSLMGIGRHFQKERRLGTKALDYGPGFWPWQPRNECCHRCRLTQFCQAGLVRTTDGPLQRRQIRIARARNVNSGSRDEIRTFAPLLLQGSMPGFDLLGSCS